MLTRREDQTNLVFVCRATTSPSGLSRAYLGRLTSPVSARRPSLQDACTLRTDALPRREAGRPALRWGHWQAVESARAPSVGHLGAPIGSVACRQCATAGAQGRRCAKLLTHSQRRWTAGHEGAKRWLAQYGSLGPSMTWANSGTDRAEDRAEGAARLTETATPDLKTSARATARPMSAAACLRVQHRMGQPFATTSGRRGCVLDHPCLLIYSAY